MYMLRLADNNNTCYTDAVHDEMLLFWSEVDLAMIGYSSINESIGVERTQFAALTS